MDVKIGYGDVVLTDLEYVWCEELFCVASFKIVSY